jgi:hypothetical protein
MPEKVDACSLEPLDSRFFSLSLRERAGVRAHLSP